MRTVALLAVLFCISTTARAQVTGVAVIAPSVSTSMKAREIRAEQSWQELTPKRADYVLVVVRSMLFDPLRHSYDCYCELVDDAERQLNISGSNFHVYIYAIDDDLSVSQLQHVKFSAD